MRLQLWMAGNVSCSLRGVRPFFSNKYDITKHKQYRYLSDYDEKNTFDIEKYVRNLSRLIVKLDMEVDEIFDAGEVEA